MYRAGSCAWSSMGRGVPPGPPTVSASTNERTRSCRRAAQYSSSTYLIVVRHILYMTSCTFYLRRSRQVYYVINPLWRRDFELLFRILQVAGGPLLCGHAAPYHDRNFRTKTNQIRLPEWIVNLVVTRRQDERNREMS